MSGGGGEEEEEEDWTEEPDPWEEAEENESSESTERLLGKRLREGEGEEPFLAVEGFKAFIHSCLLAEEGATRRREEPSWR